MNLLVIIQLLQIALRRLTFFEFVGKMQNDFVQMFEISNFAIAA